MPRLGIIAGSGDLPQKLARACSRDGRDFFVLALEGLADTSWLENYPHARIKLGATDAAIGVLKEHGVDTLVMAGGVHRSTFLKIRPDWRTIRFFLRLGKAFFGDDNLLRAVTKELGKDGFRFIGAHEVEPDLLTPEGVLGRLSPNSAAKSDIQVGIEAAKDLGRMDAGQSVVVLDGAVLGVEGVSGTDALIDQCRKMKKTGAVLVKACKPQQDRRMDLPAVGVKTVRKAHAAGFSGIALEAGASLLLDREEAIAAADQMGLFVVGFKGS